MDHVWIMVGSCLDHVWIMFGSWLDHVWIMFGSCLDHVWIIFCIYLLSRSTFAIVSEKKMFRIIKLENIYFLCQTLTLEENRGKKLKAAVVKYSFIVLPDKRKNIE